MHTGRACVSLAVLKSTLMVAPALHVHCRWRAVQPDHILHRVGGPFASDPFRAALATAFFGQVDESTGLAVGSVCVSEAQLAFAVVKVGTRYI